MRNHPNKKIDNCVSMFQCLVPFCSIYIDCNVFATFQNQFFRFFRPHTNSFVGKKDWKMDKQVQPWHIYTGIFVAFWALSALFDNFFITAILCVGCGFGSDTFRRYLGEEEADKPVKTSLKPVKTGSDPVEEVFIAPTKPLPPEPESEPENEIEHSSKPEVEEEAEVPIQ